MEKYQKIKRLGHNSVQGILDANQLTIHEKMDGANFRFMHQRHLDEEYWTDGRELVFGSRNVAYKNEKDIDSNFVHAIEYVRENIDFEELALFEELYGPAVFYGESMHKHTLDYEWDETPSFLGFDIWLLDRERFLDWPSAETAFREIGLDTVPTVEYFADDVDSDIEVPESMYRDGKAEGVVLKDYHSQQFAKVRSDEFLGKHKQQLGQTTDGERKEPPDTVKLANKLLGRDRWVEKQIHRYENEDREIGMGIMPDLWRDVFDDIIEEEQMEIFGGNWTIDTKDFRSHIAGHCAEELRRYMQRQAQDPDDRSESKLVP